MDRSNILIVDHNDSNGLKERLEKAPEFSIVGSTGNVDLAFTMAERQQPEMIILNVDMPGDEGMVIAETFAAEFPASSLVLLTNSDSKRVLRYALQVGAKDVITMPVDDEKLARILKRVFQNDMKRRELFSIQKKNKPQFKIITVFNTKGGVGKTTIALNMAIAIQQRTKKRVVAVDLDFFSGNLALMAGVESIRTIKDMVDEIQTLDKELVDDYCVSHHSGIKILSSPANPELAGFIQPEHVEKILGILSQVFNYVVVDAPTFFHDTVIPALEMSRDIVLVSTPDIVSLRNLKQNLDLLTGLSMRPKVRVVINRVGYTGHLKPKDLEEQLGIDIQCLIPSCEKPAVDAVNLGEPLILSAKSCPASRRIEEFSARVLGETAQVLGEGGQPRFLGFSIKK